MKAVQLASGMGVKDVITTEGDPKSEWGEKLSFNEKVFITAEKLHEPVRLAEVLGVRILLEPHGMLTDSIEGINAILDRLGRPDNLGVNMDTGNAWLGGADGSTALDPASVTSAEIITANLEAEDADGKTFIYENLGFSSRHPRYIGHVLPQKPTNRAEFLENPY